MLITKRPKLFIPFSILLFLITNISLYKFHEPTTEKLDTLWLQYMTSTKSVDYHRVTKIYKPDDLRLKLAKEFPYEKSTELIPRNIWQTWKTNNITSLEPGLQKLINTWASQENFTHRIIGNNGLEQFLYDSYMEKAPEIVEAFNKMPVIILKSDFMRYLMLFAYGGVYSDIDTALYKNLSDWLPYNNTLSPESNKIGLTIGLESDRDSKDWVIYMARRVQFCQWTLQAKAGHPFYRELLYRIVDLTLHHFDSKTKILTKNGKKYDFHDGSPTKYEGIMEWTGPGMYTDTVFDYLNEVYKTSELLTPGLNFAKQGIINPNPIKNQKKIKYEKLKNDGHNGYDPIERPIGWQNITKLESPILFDEDVVILPQRYLAGNFQDREKKLEVYSEHFFKGSWKG